MQEDPEAVAIFGLTNMLEFVYHSNEPLDFKRGLFELVFGERSLFPVRQILGHIQSLSKQDLIDGSKTALSFSLNFVVHNSDVNDSWHVLQEHKVIMELLEVSNHGWDSETCEYHRSSLEYLAQFLIQGPSEGTGAEFSEVYNKGFEGTSESQ